MGTEEIYTSRFAGFKVLKIPKGKTVAEMVEAYSELPNVEYTEPNYIYHINSTTPNDPSFGNLWGLNNTGQTGGTANADIDAPEACYRYNARVVRGVRVGASPEALRQRIEACGFRSINSVV